MTEAELSNTYEGPHWNPSHYAQYASFVPELGKDVLNLLDPKAHEKILDIGCGDGVLTEKIASLCNHVIGIDSSFPMVSAAIKRGLDARLERG